MYPTLLRYSSVSCIANCAIRPPDARDASIIAWFDCRLFKQSIASAYDLVDIVLLVYNDLCRRNIVLQ